MPDSASQVIPIAAVGGSPRGGATEVSLFVSPVPLPSPIDARLVLLGDPRSTRADAFRLARHRLEQRQDPRILAVTSAAPGEGKTTCAANLALAIAEEHGASVLLLDAHRESPALAGLFGLTGGASVLAAAASHHYPLYRVAGTDLHVGLALGEPGPISQAERDALRVALTDLRLSYDYLIIDTGPALAGMDVHWIAGFVDGLVFAVRRGVTDRRSLRRAIAGLMPVPLAGAVLLDA